VVAYYKGAVHTYNDVMLRREPSHQIQWEAPFTLVIQGADLQTLLFTIMLLLAFHISIDGILV